MEVLSLILKFNNTHKNPLKISFYNGIYFKHMFELLKRILLIRITLILYRIKVTCPILLYTAPSLSL